jgi:hypothetical protein
MVSLTRATICGNVQCFGSEFAAPEDKTPSVPPAGIVRYALQAESANIGGSVMMRWFLKDTVINNEPFMECLFSFL